MNPWLIGAVVLLAGAAGPGLWLASRGGPVERLVGLEIGSVAVTVAAAGCAVTQRPPLLSPGG